MKKFRFTISIMFCLIFVISTFGFSVFSAEIEGGDITKNAIISVKGFNKKDFLNDGNIKTFIKSSNNAQIFIENKESIAGIYLILRDEYGEFTITNNADSTVKNTGKPGIAHRYIDIKKFFGKPINDITLNFIDSVSISEIYLFSKGETPDFVQKWELPQQNGADLVLFTTHGDDEQLFFAGLLPLYAGEKKFRVQVVYLTNHSDSPNRYHEMLNGLWAVGVKNYPVFGSFADFRIDDLEGTYKEYEKRGTSKEDLQGFVVEQIRRFKPLVAVGHDINGEYGHGMHKVYADLLIKALDISNDKTKYSSSASKYGVWEVKKTYLHLYNENKIVIDYDTPLEKFGGLTAFQITQQKGYPCHESQQYTWFTDWINGRNNEIKKASQIRSYNPCNFGLYRSNVGQDIDKNDFFENITTYNEQERLEQEKIQQLKKDKNEQNKLEQNRAHGQQHDILKKSIIVFLIVIILLIITLIFYIVFHSRKIT